MFGTGKGKCQKSNNQGKVDSMPGIAVSYDMGWTKRGKGHNSYAFAGHGASMVEKLERFCLMRRDVKPAVYVNPAENQEKWPKHTTEEKTMLGPRSLWRER